MVGPLFINNEFGQGEIATVSAYKSRYFGHFPLIGGNHYSLTQECSERVPQSRMKLKITYNTPVATNTRGPNACNGAPFRLPLNWRPNTLHHSVSAKKISRADLRYEC